MEFDGFFEVFQRVFAIFAGARDADFRADQYVTLGFVPYDGRYFIVFQGISFLYPAAPTNRNRVYILPLTDGIVKPRLYLDPAVYPRLFRRIWRKILYTKPPLVYSYRIIRDSDEEP